MYIPDLKKKKKQISVIWKTNCFWYLCVILVYISSFLLGVYFVLHVRVSYIHAYVWHFCFLMISLYSFTGSKILMVHACIILCHCDGLFYSPVSGTLERGRLFLFANQKGVSNQYYPQDLWTHWHAVNTNAENAGEATLCLLWQK